MQRYNAASCGAGVSNSSIGGVSARKNAWVDSSFSTSNHFLSSRKETVDKKICRKKSKRSSPLHPYKIKCEKEHLNIRIGPPDFYPQTSDCLEERLTREYLQSGYKETVEGIEEAREIILTQSSCFTKPEIILKCKEAIRKRLRAINVTRTQKRKAGQVYGVPLSGSLLIKPGTFPEQKPSSEEFRKKWVEGLSLHHKRLRSLADHIPHGYRKKSLFEVLIRHNVPLLRAMWFIKVTYLNQVRPTSASVSSGALDKAQIGRSELWTRDIVEYLQQLLDELLLKDGSVAVASSEDQSSPSLLLASGQKTGFGNAISDAEEPSLQCKWRYMLYLLRWSYSEGLLLPSIIIEWVLNELQKDSPEAFEMLFPILYDVIDIIALSQTYTRGLVDAAVRSINHFSQGDSNSILTSKKSSLSSAYVEMLRYLLLAAPDTFVALDCFPLPACVIPVIYHAHVVLKVPEDIDCLRSCKEDAYIRYMSFGHALSSIQKRTSNLAKIANSRFKAHGIAKVVQLLDKASYVGDARIAYGALFEDFYDFSMAEKWMAEISPSLWASLKWIGTVDLAFICSVFFLCEWATCNYRNRQTTTPENLKISGMKDFSKVYAALVLLKLKMEHMHVSSQPVNSNLWCSSGKAVPLHDNDWCIEATENCFVRKILNTMDHVKNGEDAFHSPGPFHDIVVCWLDQHEIGKYGGFMDFEVLIMELIRNGIFYPPAYTRQLIVSGIMDRNETSFDLERRRRHYRILKQLPASYLFDVLDEARIIEVSRLHEIVRIYSNERQLILHGSFKSYSGHLGKKNDSYEVFSFQKQNDHQASSREGSSTMLLQISSRNSNTTPNFAPTMSVKAKEQVAELKVLISSLLHFPFLCSSHIETQVDGSSGIRFDSSEGITDCDDCREARKQKLSDERTFSHQVFPSNQSVDEETWWVKKDHKYQEPMKVEPTDKLAMNVSRSRQKIIQKMQSLSQLAASRIESSEGTSASIVCDNKVSCHQHRSGIEGKGLKDAERLKSIHNCDVGKTIKRLRMLEKRSISIWLSASIRELVDGHEKASPTPSNSNVSFSIPLDVKTTARWKLGEEELSTILYILEISSDLVLAVRMLLWLLPKVLDRPSKNANVGRSIIMLNKSRENHIVQVGEAFLLSALQRYENMIVASDLLPELLTAIMHRTMAMLTPNGRPSNVASFAYSRNLLKKYRDVASVDRWERRFRATCDRRLLVELDTGHTHDVNVGFSSRIPGGTNDLDEYIHRKANGRVSRTGPSMKEIVQRHVQNAMHYFHGKEREPFSAVNPKNSPKKWDDAYEVAYEIVTGLTDCIWQNGSSVAEEDPTILASAVSAIVGNVGPAVLKVSDYNCDNCQSASTVASLSCVRYILYIHIISLSLLKDALGERLGHILEIALATEASAAIVGSVSSIKSHQNQYQVSPGTHDMNPNHSSEMTSSSSNVFSVRTLCATVVVSALVIGVIVHGAVTLERMVTVFKLKEGLDVLQLIRTSRSSSNGMPRSIGNFKVEHNIEIFIHWFRLLVGNSGTICDGLISEILGESYIIALSRMQRMLPLNLVFPPAYSIFAMVIWRPYILNSVVANCEDIQLHRCLSLAINETIRHQPFRDVCFQNSHAFYDLLTTDAGDSEFAAMLELHNPDKELKTKALVPLRARVFLKALIDNKMPSDSLLQEDGSLILNVTESITFSEMEQNILNQLVHILETLQPAKFHWQWVELRLLLNEKAFLEKINTKDMSFVEAIQSLLPNAENFAVSESDKFLLEIILTRILVRPDAATLYAEIVHILGRSLEESLLMSIKWILAGNDVLSGHKSIRQQLVAVSQRKSLSIKALFWKPWGWPNSMVDVASMRVEKNKLEPASIEEEVIEDGLDAKKSGKMNLSAVDANGFSFSQLYLTEKALADLILPCIDSCSTDFCNWFAGELIKQMNMIDQQINLFTRGANKQTVSGTSGVEVASKSSTWKSMRSGAPGLGRRTTVTDTCPPYASALKASIWLRLQFLVRLLPIIFSDRSMRLMLASIILHLVGSQFIYEDADIAPSIAPVAPLKGEMEFIDDSTAALVDYSGDSLFDTLLCVLHGLLSNCWPSWLKPNSASKSTSKSSRDFISSVDLEAAEDMQADLDRMELPSTIRRRLQAALPILPTSITLSLPCHPPTLSPTILSSTQRCSLFSTLHVKSKARASEDLDAEIDPWTLLEDGAICSASSAGSAAASVNTDISNFKACSWLRGSVRVRRTDLTYAEALDDER